MKAIVIICLIVIFQCAGYSQLHIDTGKRIIWGTQQNYTNGLSLFDEGSSDNTPFRLGRRSDDNIYFTRSNDFKGFMMHPNGKISVIDKDPTNNYYMYNALFNIQTTSAVGLQITQRTTLPAIHIDGYGENSKAIYVYGPNAQDEPFLLQGDGSIVMGWKSLFTIRKGGSQYTRFEVRSNGDIWCSGSQLFASDGRLKKNIETIDSPLSKILRLRGVMYDWVTPEEEMALSPVSMKADTTRHFLTQAQMIEAETQNAASSEIKQKMIEERTERKTIGLIAQEVEQVLPEVVRTNENGLLGISYNQLIGLLIEGIKEQQIQIEQLQQDIEALQQEQNGHSALAEKNK